MDCTMMRYMKDYTLLVKQCSSAFFYKSICFIACKTRLDSNVKYKVLKKPKIAAQLCLKMLIC